MGRSEDAQATSNVNARRVAVRSIAWLDDELERALELDRIRNDGVICVVSARLLLLNGEL